MFGGLIIRLFFAILLYLIASKKKYGRMIWSAMGFLLGPIALVAIFIYRKNANYSKALLAGLSGTLAGALLALVGWFIYPYLSSIEQMQMINRYTGVFWYAVFPTFSIGLGLVFFIVSMVRNNR